MGNEIKSFIKKHWKILTLTSIAVFVVVPFLINLAFKYNFGISWLQAEWTAGDALSFYGTLLAAGVGIVGVFFSIQYAQKGYKDDIQNQVRPYFAVTRLRGKSNFNLFWNLTPSHETTPREEFHPLSDVVYEEATLEGIYIIIEGNTIHYRTALNPDEEALLKTKGFDKHLGMAGSAFIQQTPFLSMPLQIENVGNGPAVSTRSGFGKGSSFENRLEPVQLKKGDSFYIHIFSSSPINHIFGQYTLSILYYDIYQNEYTQDYPFTVNEKGYNLNLNIKQKLLNLD